MSETNTEVQETSHKQGPGAPAPKQKPGASEDEKYLQSLRDEAYKFRTERNELQSQVESLNKQVSKFSNLESLIKKGLGEDEDPEKVITSLKSENHRLKLQHAFNRVSRQLDADEELTFATLQAKGQLEGIDPSDEKNLTKLITGALESNPKLRATPLKKAGDNGADTGGEKAFDFNNFIRSKGRA